MCIMELQNMGEELIDFLKPILSKDDFEEAEDLVYGYIASQVCPTDDPEDLLEGVYDRMPQAYKDEYEAFIKQDMERSIPERE